MELDVLTVLIIGLAAGGVIGYLLARLLSPGADDRVPRLKMELQMEQERVSKLTAELTVLNGNLKEEREKIIALSTENSGIKADRTS